MNNKIRRIAALTGIVFIASMYLISLISAFFASKELARGIFLASVFCTIVIPIMIYLFVLVYKMVHKNDTPKDSDTTKPPE